MFICTKCGSKQSKIIETRLCGENVIRLRICKACNNRMYTEESKIDYFDGWDKLSKFYRKQRSNHGIKT